MNSDELCDFLKKCINDESFEQTARVALVLYEECIKRSKRKVQGG